METLKDNLITVPQQRHELKISLETSSVKDNLKLSVNSLSKAVNNLLLLKKLNFDLESKDRLVIMGPNGAGKTTLLKILNGSMQPDEVSKGGL